MAGCSSGGDGGGSAQAGGAAQGGSAQAGSAQAGSAQAGGSQAGSAQAGSAQTEGGQGGGAGSAQAGKGGAAQGGGAQGGAGQGGAQGGSAGASGGGCVPAPDLGVLKEAPAQLSATGLPEDGTVPAYIRSFTPRFELWSDGAVKDRFAYLPGCEAIDASDMDHWQLPVGGRFWKHFRINGALVETRFIHRFGPGADDWIFATYQWDQAQAKASLVNDGVNNANGTEHDIPAQWQCRRCHGFLPERVLGFSALQLSHGGEGLTAASLVGEGRLPAAAGVGFSPPGDEVTREALGYIHANCGHCHNDAFGLPLRMRLRVGDAKLEDTDIFKTAVGVASLFQPDGYDTRIVPGDPEKSLLVHRLESRGNDAQMPPLATEKVNPAGSAKVRAWIESLDDGSGGAGGAGGGATEPLSVSGSRLKARYQVSADGYKEFVGWYDTQLKMKCFIGYDSDGAPRCLPQAQASLQYFVDAACTKEGTGSECSPDGGQYATQQIFDETSCVHATRSRVLRLSPEASKVVYAKIGDECVLQTETPGAVSAVEEVVDPSKLAGFTVQELPAHKDGFGLVVYQGEDGSRQAFGAWSQVAGRVRPMGLDDSKEHWAPDVPTAYDVSSYVDASCTGARAGYAYDCDGTPVIALGFADDWKPGSCAGQAIFNVLEPLPKEQKVYANYSGTCNEEPGPGKATWYRLGDKLDPSTLALTNRVKLGGKRLQRSYLATPEGQPVAMSYASGDMIDTQEGFSCYPATTTDGKVRCVPAGPGAQAYADDQCTQPLATTSKTPDPCGSQAAPKYAVLLDYFHNGCGTAPTAVFEIQGEAAPTKIYQKDGGGSCSPGQVDEQARYLTLGAPVDPSKFVELTEVQDP